MTRDLLFAIIFMFFVYGRQFDYGGMRLTQNLIPWAKPPLRTFTKSKNIAYGVQQQSMIVASFALYEIVFLQLLQVKT